MYTAGGINVYIIPVYLCQTSLQKQQPSSSNTQSQHEKLEKLESEYLKLSKTQTVAEVIRGCPGVWSKH